MEQDSVERRCGAPTTRDDQFKVDECDAVECLSLMGLPVTSSREGERCGHRRGKKSYTADASRAMPLHCHRLCHIFKMGTHFRRHVWHITRITETLLISTIATPLFFSRYLAEVHRNDRIAFAVNLNRPDRSGLCPQTTVVHILSTAFGTFQTDSCVRRAPSGVPPTCTLTSSRSSYEAHGLSIVCYAAPPLRLCLLFSH